MEQLPLSCIGKHRWYLYREHGCGRRTENLYFRRKRKAASRPEVSAGRSADLSQMAVRPEVGEYTYLLRNTPLGVVENAPTQVLKNAQSYILWDLLGNNRLMRMLENESVNGKKAFTVVELMDGLHRNIFATTERGALPDVMTRALQKNFVDALITAAAESEGVKINKKLMDNHFLLDHQTALCSCDEHAGKTLDADRMGAHRELNFYGSQINRVSDVISVKRGELLRIKELLQNRLGASDIATKYHYKDLILRINTALGVK